MAYVFISYSHKDREYAHKLADELQRWGIDAWIDDRINYGTEWPKVIQKQLDGCGAFIVILSENAFESKWVQNEVARAHRKKKTFFPLLFQGDPWLSVEATQYVDVRTGALPPNSFFEMIKNIFNIQRAPAESEQGLLSKHTKSKKALTQKIGLVVAYLALITALIGLVSEAIPSATRYLEHQESVKATQTAEARLWTATPTVTLGPTSTSTPTATPTALPAKIIRKKDKMAMLLVIGNTFQMGSIYGEEYSLGDEYPIHDVQLDTYWIDEHEVTNEQYKLCVQDNYCSIPMENTVNGNGYFEETEYDNYPVVNVTWEQAKVFCEWAEVSLPTEAQWEYSARGTKRVVFPWGNSEPNDELANYSSDGPKPVEFYPKGVSWVGAFDMAGNVFEWVNDWYDGNYYSVSPVQNPPGSTTESATKVLRGGSWRYDVQTLRTANRNSNHPLSYFDNVGFRCARNLSQ